MQEELAMVRDDESDGTEDRLKELASLARLVTFARERARALDAAFPAYCLELALGAILQEMYPAPGPDGHAGSGTHRLGQGPDADCDEPDPWLSRQDGFSHRLN